MSWLARGEVPPSMARPNTPRAPCTVAARARTRATAFLRTGGAESMRGEVDWRGNVGSA